MDLKVARAIEQALRGDDDQLLAYDFGEMKEPSVERPHSVFPDGTFFGMVAIEEVGESQLFDF